MTRTWFYSDNPRNSTAAFVSPANPAYTGSLAALSLQAILVRVNDPATLERVRTFLATHAPPDTSAGLGVTLPLLKRMTGPDGARFE